MFLDFIQKNNNLTFLFIKNAKGIDIINYYFFQLPWIPFVKIKIIKRREIDINEIYNKVTTHVLLGGSWFLFWYRK